MMRLVFICHPYAGDIEKHERCVRDIAINIAADRKRVPMAPQIYLPQIYDEATDRAHALDVCEDLLWRCDEIRVYGEPSPGMRREIGAAMRRGMRIVRITHTCGDA